MLRRYLTRLVLARLLGCLFGLAAILQLLDLLDRAGDLLSHGGMAGIGHFISLRFPALITEMLPLATLLGAVLAFRQLAGSMEMTALRAAGVSLGQILARLLPLCLVLSAVQFLLRAEVAPRADRDLAAWLAVTIPAEPATPPPRLWLRAQGDIAAIDTVAPDGRRLDRLMIVQRLPDGDLAARLDAQTARYADGHWTLYDVRLAQPGAGMATKLGQLPWPHGPVPDNMIALTEPPADMPLGRLIATLRGRWVGAFGPAYYQTALCGLLAGLLDPLLMLLLAAPVLVAPPRAERAAWTAPVSLALGLGYLVSAGLLAALGDAQILPPWIAGGAATLLYGVIGMIRLQAFEQG